MENQNSIQPTVPIVQKELSGFKALFSEAWGIFKQRMGFFITLGIIPSLVVMLGIFIVGGSGFLFALLAPKESSSFFILIPLIIIFVIVMVIVQIWSMAAMFYAVKEAKNGISVKEAFRISWPKIGSVAWLSFLSSIVMMAGFLLLIVPGIIFATWYSFAIFVLINEDIVGWGAMTKSKEYVQGRWGAVFGRLLGMYALAILVSWIASMIPFAPFILNLFITPIVTIYTFLLYKELKATKQSYPSV